MLRTAFILATWIVLIAVVLGGCASIIEQGMGNRQHTATCAELPTVAEVEKILQDHQAVLERIQAVNPGLVFVDVDNRRCGGHADVLITVGSVTDSQRVQEIIGAETFWGVPFRIINQ